ncbi:hypothetical protein CLV91_3156 [Maribacter vaceletii]|uniref:N,N-dimethylformamidase beta subunit-like C-terminal domain-containing protein n=1 Tax=Maribacter vaceletii TaxID=1206816 RepID=A0A495DVQ2_9FLAO|nr:N,N-dimethylformamidase beta subunit family domain-containing protein [Maribacter vaceletii]RKR07171.1 hypothetical protein CLV91_3156 [Maribacter vaceletii]
MNPISLENQKQGTKEWELQNPAINREIEGYLSSTSIDSGESIDLFVNTKANEFSFSLYRMGWYSSNGARLILDSILIKGTSQKIPLPEKDTGFIECNWINPYTINTLENWVSGVYIGKLEELKTKKQSYVIFVLRNDKRNSDILFQLPVTTYQAYNYWGGKCLYTHGSGSAKNWGTISGKKAIKASFNRPYVRSNNPDAAYGMGAGDFFTNTRPVTTHGYPISSAGWDYNMLRWLERNGYDVSYITNIDTHNSPKLLIKTPIFMSVGHDEYWSKAMRKNITSCRDCGVNLTFFSSNTMYWQIRFEKSKYTNIENSTIICYKETDLDPMKGDNETINFSDLPSQKSQASLIGIEYYLDPVKGDITITKPNHWIFKGTNLKKGSKLKGLLGYEIDGISKDSPSNIEILATSKCQRVEKSNNWFVIKYMLQKMHNIICGKIISKLRLKSSLNNYIIISLMVSGIVLLNYLDTQLNLPISYIVGIITFAVLLFWFIKIKISDVFISNMTYYKSINGGEVFATGSMQWSWGLDNFNAPKLRSQYISKETQIITSNVLRHFGAKDILNSK